MILLLFKGDERGHSSELMQPNTAGQDDQDIGK